MLKLSEIWIYPVKSFGGIRLKQAEVLGKGLRYDRRWMLIDEKHQFMTQRDFPLMALFKMAQQDEVFLISFKGENMVLDPNEKVVEEELKTIIWDDNVNVFEVSKAHSHWISDRLGHTCKLVYFPEENPRAVPLEFNVNNEHVSLADGYPILILGQSSLDDLNNRMAQPILMNRFRPNFVFTGGDSFEEDHWKEFSVGDVKFKAVKPCGRCVLTLVNQETAIQEKEPLRTLATFREFDQKIKVGMNVLALTTGIISEGQEIQLV